MAERGAVIARINTETAPSARSHPADARLLARLLGEPFIEHWAREADVPPNPPARQ
jgi:hypothetical protein